MNKAAKQDDDKLQPLSPRRRMAFRPGIVAFGRHESFPLRFAWIAKGLNAVRADPDIFTREDATVVLGVGKNMVSSIRHWLHAATLVRQRPDGHGYEETELARTAFGSDGDPYLEDDGTIWLLHWLLATNPAAATAVYWFFNHFHRPVFANDEAAAGLRAFVDTEAATRTSPTTLNRDATTLLRMYTRTAAGTRLALEDALDSPLSLLDLVDRVDAHHRRSVPAARPGLPSEIFAFAVAEVFDHLGAPHVAVQHLMYSDRTHCAPGAVFRMTEESLVHKIEELHRTAPGHFRLDRTAGVYQLYRLRRTEPLHILDERFHGRGRTAA